LQTLLEEPERRGMPGMPDVSCYFLGDLEAEMRTSYCASIARAAQCRSMKSNFDASDSKRSMAVNECWIVIPRLPQAVFLHQNSAALRTSAKHTLTLHAARQCVHAALHACKPLSTGMIDVFPHDLERS
jgi:hypothetical protein